jgi:tripartite-type tricarboxylate transporter receptor subunit TctC
MKPSTHILNALLLGLVFVPTAQADGYPNKPIRLVVPFTAGGTTDLIARAISQKTAEALGQPLVVDNKAGAGGSIGSAELARASADGYTLGMATVSTTATNPAVYPALAYKPLTDFTPIVNIAITPNVLAVHPSFLGKDYASFLAEVKKNPQKYSYGTAGNGSICHMLMALFAGQTGMDLAHVPYKGSGPALNDTIAGQVPMVCDNLPSALPFIKSGRLVPIVVAAPTRIAQLPHVPTFKEVGLENVNRSAFYGIAGPKGLPREVVVRVHAAVLKALADPAVKMQIEGTGSHIAGGTPEQFARDMAAEHEAYRQIALKYKITAD